MYFSMNIYEKDDKTFVANCPELELFSFASSAQNAQKRLKKIVGFYLSSADEMGIDPKELGDLSKEPLQTEKTASRFSTLSFGAVLH